MRGGGRDPFERAVPLRRAQLAPLLCCVVARYPRRQAHATACSLRTHFALKKVGGHSEGICKVSDEEKLRSQLKEMNNPN
jgi:hypothetical protein